MSVKYLVDADGKPELESFWNMVDNYNGVRGIPPIGWDSKYAVESAISALIEDVKSTIPGCDDSELEQEYDRGYNKGYDEGHTSAIEDHECECTHDEVVDLQSRISELEDQLEQLTRIDGHF